MYWEERAQKQFRPEQFTLREYFQVFAPQLEVILEDPVYNREGQLVGIPDLIDHTNKIIWLLDGGSHEFGGRIKKKKDEIQVEEYEELGYTVKIVKKDSFSWRWLWPK